MGTSSPSPQPPNHPQGSSEYFGSRAIFQYKGGRHRSPYGSPYGSDWSGASERSQADWKSTWGADHVGCSLVDSDKPSESRDYPCRCWLTLSDNLNDSGDHPFPWGWLTHSDGRGYPCRR